MTKRSQCLFLFVSLFILIPLNSAKACTCDLPPMDKSLERQIGEARGNSKAVFVGKVVEIISPAELLYTTVRLQVESGWKGVDSKEITILTGRGGSCGYNFEVGEVYLVYAYAYNESNLGTNVCQRTIGIQAAGDDLKFLGKPKFKVTRPETVIRP